MELNQIATQDGQLNHLLQSAQYFNQLDQAIKRLLPPNLHEHCRVSCIEDGKLLLAAYAPMAASRLKMLLPALLPSIQAIDENIQQIQVYMQPKNPNPKHQKDYHIPPDALPYFERTAEQVAQHPQLAQALRDLVRHQQK